MVTRSLSCNNVMDMRKIIVLKLERQPGTKHLHDYKLVKAASIFVWENVSFKAELHPEGEAPLVCTLPIPLPHFGTFWGGGGTGTWF